MSVIAPHGYVFLVGVPIDFVAKFGSVTVFYLLFICLLLLIKEGSNLRFRFSIESKKGGSLDFGKLV